MLPTRFLLSTLLALSCVFVLPSAVFAWTVTRVDTIDATDASGFDPYTQSSGSNTDYSAIVFDVQVNERIDTFNAVDIWGLKTLDGSIQSTTTTQGKEQCLGMYMKIYNMSTSTYLAYVNGIDPDGPESGQSPQVVLQNYTLITTEAVSTSSNQTSTFFSPDLISLNPGNYTFILTASCEYPTHWWHFSIDADHADRATTTDNSLTYYTSYLFRYNQSLYNDPVFMNTTYTGYPNASGIRMYLDTDYDINGPGSFIQIQRIQFTTSSSTIYSTECSNDSTTGITTSCSTATTSDSFFVSWYAEYPSGSTAEWTVDMVLTNPDGTYPFDLPSSSWQQHIDLDAPMAWGESLFALQRGDSYPDVTGMYNLHICVSEAMAGQVCTDMLICNNVDSTECEDTRSTMVFGVNNIIPPGWLAGQGDASTTETFLTEVFNTIKYGFPYGYLVYLYEAWQSYELENATTSTTTDFIIEFDVSEFRSPNGSGITNLTASGTPVGSWNMTQAYRDGLAEYDTAGLVDKVDAFLWAIFGLFLVWRIATDSWQAIGRGVGDSYIRGRREFIDAQSIARHTPYMGKASYWWKSGQ